jgi:hypothetical protein
MIRIVIVLLLLAAFGFYIVVNHSEVRVSYVCEGETRASGVATPETAYFELINWRPWVKLWSDRDGMAWMELDRAAMVTHFMHNRIDAGLGQYRFSERKNGVSQGGFRVAPVELNFVLADNWIFTGRCQLRDR